MVIKCCETCIRNEGGCRLDWICTRHWINKDIENKDVSPMSVGVNEPHDYWDEGEGIENIMYRIREIEKKLEGV